MQESVSGPDMPHYSKFAVTECSTETVIVEAAQAVSRKNIPRGIIITSTVQKCLLSDNTNKSMFL